MRRSLLSLTLISLVGPSCTERITAPEAVRLIEELESPRTSKDVRRLGSLLERKEWLKWGRQNPVIPGESVEVWRDGRLLSFRAHVIERVMPPVQLDSTDRCARATLDRRSALLWSETPGSGGIWLYTSGPSRPLGRDGLRMCSSLKLVGPEAILQLYPDLDDPDQDNWISESGQAEISPGIEVGTCDFFHPETLRSLRIEAGVSCVRTRHTISFRAVVERTGQTMSLDLARTVVDGIRYIVHCDGTGKFGAVDCRVRTPPYSEPFPFTVRVKERSPQ